jgi:hypothetical protein
MKKLTFFSSTISKIILAASALVIVFAVGYSCTNAKAEGKISTYEAEIKKLKHQIPFNMANTMIQKFKENKLNLQQGKFIQFSPLPDYETFNIIEFRKLVNNPEYVAINAHLGINENNQVAIVFTGVTADGKDIIKEANEDGIHNLKKDPTKVVIIETGQREP